MSLALALLTTCFAEQATGLTVERSITRSTPLMFGAEDVCASTDTDSMTLPRRVPRLQVVRPLPGDEIGPSSVTIVAASVRAGASHTLVTWTAAGQSGFCDGMTGDGWEGQTEGVVRFDRAVRLRLKGYVLQGLAQIALERLHLYFRRGSVEQFHCAVTHHTSGRCRATWFIGDANYSGRVIIALGANRARTGPVWRNRIRLIHTDVYCLAVGHKDCRHPIRRTSRRLPLSWHFYDRGFARG